MTALHTEYVYEHVPHAVKGTVTTLSHSSTGKSLAFYNASFDCQNFLHLRTVNNFWNSLTDDLCADFFKAQMTPEEQKAARKAKAEERRLAEEASRLENERVAALRKAEKLAEKERKKNKRSGPNE